VPARDQHLERLAEDLLGVQGVQAGEVHLVVVLVDAERDHDMAGDIVVGNLLIALLLARARMTPMSRFSSRWMLWLLPLSQFWLMLRCSALMSTLSGPAGSLVGSVGSAVMVMAVPL
jgi:hypothetical protein